ncbi:MAG: glutamine-hydrolyzing GMP synthase [Verrucomicrobiales bacterium]|jgi:GMP synthase (glutamine-hydrolysing)|nr:glutamine-hydrolyzing GMP synthase [Verrucomicrobiales bacterium]MDA7643983.1 glutamine-hydrolyzing GMP synthase [Verrucomicrobiales bacterium]MDF1785983.1 glutamine-hydrolyzing GMP synthase [Verrucomicrobiales bacterium]
MQVQIAVIDFGSQYTQLIVRRVRELGYFAKLFQPSELPSVGQPVAVILSGGPRSVTEIDAPDIDYAFLETLNVPVLGICYGMQLLNLKHGGEVAPSHSREYGPAQLEPTENTGLFAKLSDSSQIWMSHSDTVSNLPENTKVLGKNQEGIPVALSWRKGWYGIQFHPEVTHSHEGTQVLRNFLEMTNDPPRFEIQSFRDETIAALKAEIGDREVICGVSGGVDSTVLAVLLNRAGSNVRPIFVDNGLLRKGESDQVVESFKQLGLEIERVDARDRFLQALAGEDEPERKRHIIGNLFLDVFWDAAKDVQLLAQGTLYPDVIESATSGSIASRIKTHHNRVDRILELQKEGRVLEPLAELFKDEVRALGKSLDIPDEMLFRHPFPGPGLAVRVPGEITEDRLKIVREADAVFIGNLRKHGWYDKVWQAYAALLPVRTVGVKGDERSYEHAIALRAVVSEDAMTADWVELPHALLRESSNTILNTVAGVNRVFYDISTKPPASIELE